ncbi:MAG: hypothetical protein KME52_30250 [Desmonostoc geniculatum HA4340-LM1]|jgi:hypothetical protein|nr:hypothetical protein [Desmonostoc geniculatum HA4340-LM1]
MNQPTLFDLEAFTLSLVPTPVYDPYWDEIETAPQHSDDDRWNPAHFGEVPRKAEGDQLTIFWDDSDEPPAPDDYQNLDDYNSSWREWELRVGGQNSQAEQPYQSVGGQVTLNTQNTCTPHTREVICNTQKSAPQHDTHWVERYWVERSGNKYWYFRYCWMVGRKIHRHYLGSVNSKLAKRKKADIEVWISDGQPPGEIEKLIHSWKSYQERSPF